MRLLLWSSVLALTLSATYAYADQDKSKESTAIPQTLVRGNSVEPATLDPHKAQGIPEMNILYDLLEGLVIQDKDGNIIPAVASSWKTKDNKHFIFTLREDAKWSNGEPVTAQDFVYSFQRLVDPKTASPYSWYVEMTSIQNAKAIIKGKKKPSELGVKATGKHTLEIQLEEALPYFINMLAHATLLPVHQATIEKHGDKWTRPANFTGNGAYTLKQWVVNEKIELERNPAYWDNQATDIDQVTYLGLDDENTEMKRFLAGELDITAKIPEAHFKKLQKEQPDSVKVSAGICTYYYGFNSKKAPFTDSRVRQALAYAIDRDVVAHKIKGMGEAPAYNFVHQSIAGLNEFTPDYAKLTQAKRLEKAKALLSQAQFDKDKPIKILYASRPMHKKLALAVAAMWKPLDIKTQLEAQEWKTYLSTRRQGGFEVIAGNWCGDYNEASTFLAFLKEGNWLNYESKPYNDLLKQAMRATSAKKRADIYEQAEKMLATDMPLAPVYYFVNASLVKPKLKGFPINNVEGKVYSKDLSF